MTIASTSTEITLQTYDGEARVDTYQLAARMNVQHESVMRLVNTYEQEIRKFGHLRFESRAVKNSVGAVNHAKFALLTEDQCYFLLTLIRNSETTVPMKQELIVAFAAFRRASQTAQLPNFSDPVAAARAWADAKEREQQALVLAEANQEKAAGFDAFLDSSGLYSIRNAAKLLGTGERKLFEILRDGGVLMSAARADAENHNVPYQKHIDAGHFKVKTSHSRDGEHVSRTPRVTPAGLEYLRRRFFPGVQLPLLLEDAGD